MTLRNRADTALLDLRTVLAEAQEQGFLTKQNAELLNAYITAVKVLLDTVPEKTKVRPSKVRKTGASARRLGSPGS